MDRLLRAIITLSLSGVFSSAALAQNQNQNQNQNQGQDSSAVAVPGSAPGSASIPIEEITVLGEKTLFTLRLEIESAETKVFDLFNDLNSSDDFDITCTKEVYVGSHFKKRSCMAAYLREAQARNTQDYLYGIDIQLSLNGVKGDVRQRSIAMEAEMRSLALENHSFAAALLKLTELVGILELRKTKNPFFFGRK